MIQFLSSHKNGNIVTYSKGGDKKVLENFESLITKSDEYSIVREIETEIVSKNFGLIGNRDITIKTYPYKSEIIYDKKGNIVCNNFFKKNVSIEVIKEEVSSSKNDGIYKDYESLPSELKEIFSEDTFKDKNLIVATYLSSSGSNFIYSSNAYYEDNMLNITHIVKIPDIGTCDMKIYTTYTFVEKSYSNSDNYIVRFIEEDVKNFR